MFDCQWNDSAEDSKKVKWANLWLWRYGSSEASLWSFWWEKNSQIFWWDSGCGWQRSHYVKQFHIQGHGSVGVSSQSSNTWRNLLLLRQKRNGQFLSQAMKNKKNDRTVKLFNKLKHPSNRIYFGFSQKNSCRCQMVNSLNDGWFTLSTQYVRIEMKTKHPVYMMVFGMVTSNGDVIPPFIFPHGFRLQAELKMTRENWRSQNVLVRMCGAREVDALLNDTRWKGGDYSFWGVDGGTW